MRHRWCLAAVHDDAMLAAGRARTERATPDLPMQTPNRAPLVVSTLVAVASLGIAGTTLGLYFQQADALARLEAEQQRATPPAALTPEASHEHEPEPVVRPKPKR